MKKKIFSIFTAAFICASMCNILPAKAESNTFNFPYATGGLPSPSFCSDEVTYTTSVFSTTDVLPTVVDNSTSTAFPCIGNQGNIGSCTAWAATYYQFTHEVNKIRGTAAKEMVNGEYVNIDENVYSPTWTYNYINGGANNGTYLSDAYRVLKYQGAMTLAEMPYDASNYDFDEWVGNIDKLTSALEYRTTYSYIYSLEDAKSILADGHTLVAWTNAYGWDIEPNSNGQYFIVRCGNDTDDDGNQGGHYVNIVGYNDNIQINVNGVTLTGAFKIANSWGSDWGNDGFIWVSYDALKTTSEFSNWETNYDGLRTPIFRETKFGWLSAHHCQPTFIGYVEYVTTKKYDISIYADDSTTVGVTNSYHRWLNSLYDTETVSCGSTPPKILVFDYFSPSDTINVGNYLISNWTIRLDDETTDNSGTICMRTRVLDNFGEIIGYTTHNYTNLTNGTATITTPVNLAKGRVTAYDTAAITSADSQLVLDFLTLSAELSNVQLYLADYNSDGKVSMSDVVAMNSDIAARNGETYAITDYIDEWGCSLADVIEEQYDMPIEQYVSENYAELSALDAIPADMNVSAY